MSKIHPTAYIHPKANIEQGCDIGAFCEIGPNTHIGSNTVVQSHCSLGVFNNADEKNTLFIGANSVLRSHTILYSGSEILSEFTTGHHTTVRENSRIGQGVQIGTNSDVQGSLEIGNYVKVHSSVFIPQNTIIEDYVWLFPKVTLTDDPHPPSETRRGILIKKYASIGANVTIVPGVIIHQGTFVGAGSTVIKDTGENEIWLGSPAVFKGMTDQIINKDTGKVAYPWRRHFHRGYPEAAINNWIKEFPDG